MADGPWEDFASSEPPKPPPQQTGPWQNFAPRQPSQMERIAAELGMPFPSEVTPENAPQVEASATAAIVKHMVDSTLSLLGMPGKGVKEGLTPEEETAFGFNVATMTELGGRGTIPRVTEEMIAPVVKQFNEQVGVPAATKTIEDAPTEGPALLRTIQEAQQLHVIGPDKPEPTFNEKPLDQAFEAVPTPLSAAVTPEAAKGEILPPEARATYEARFKEWISKIDSPDKVRNVIESSARENDLFPMAREEGAELPASHVAAVAEAAGLDPADIDRAGLATRFDNPAKVRAVIQALRHTAADVADAGDKNVAAPTDENAAALLEAQERQKYVMEYTLGLRAESGRTLNAWKDLLREQERAAAVVKIRADETAGKAPPGLGDLINAAGEVRSNVSNPEAQKLGLQKLVDAAEKLATEPKAIEGKPREPLPADVEGLVGEAKKALKQLKQPEVKKPGDSELEKFRNELTSLSEGKGSVNTTADAARKLIDAIEKEKKPPTGEPPKATDVPRGRLVAMAKRLMEAQDGKDLLAGKKIASPELAALSEATRVAAGYLKEGRVRPAIADFRQALEDFKATGNGTDLEAKSKALLDALGELKDKQNIEPKALVEIDKITAAARKFVDDSQKAAKELLPADLKSIVENSSAALSEMNKAEKTELEKTVAAAERQVGNILRQRRHNGGPPMDDATALPPEWQELVNKADFVTKRFGGVAKGTEAAFLLARSGRTAAEQADLARSIQGLTPNQVARVLDRIRKNPDPHWAFWAVQQGLISGLITHTKYFLVNTAQTFMDRVIVPEVAAIIGKARGQDTSLLAPLRAGVSIFTSVPDAVAGFRQAFKTGQRVPLASELKLAERGEPNPEAAGAQVPYGSQSQRVNFGVWKKVFNQEQLDKAARVIGVPGRSANAIHTFFKILNERASLADTAFEAAQKDAAVRTDKFWERYQHHLDNPTDTALKQSVEDGYSGTFMEKLGPQTEAMGRIIRNTPFKWLVFFTHIPFNMIRAGIKNSPVALLNMLGETKMGKALRGDLGSEAQNLMFAHVTVGSAISAYFIHKTLSGAITGDYPTDAKEKQRWKDLNIQPNSMQVNGQWMSLDRLGPYAMAGHIAANTAQAFQYYAKDEDEGAMMRLSLALALGTAKVLGDDVGFETLRNIVDVMENPKEAARFAAWQLSSYAMPVSFITQGASALDPNMREAKTLADGFKYHIPIMRESLLPKRDPLYGTPLPNPGYHAILRSTPITFDPVKTELDRLGYFPAAPKNTIGDHIKLSPEQYDRYQATAGPLVHAALDRLVHSENWPQRAPEQQKLMIQKTIEDMRHRAALPLLAENPDLIRQGIAAARTRHGLPAQP